MNRIIAKIINGRLKEAYEMQISETQFGFRRNRSTSDGILILTTIVEKYSDPLKAVNIDLTAAHDHLPRDFLFRLTENGCNPSCSDTTKDVRGHHSIN